VPETWRARGIMRCDAPVSGGGQAATEGRLVVMVGGDRADVDLMRPVLATFGDPALLVGQLAAGQVAKAPNNLLITGHSGRRQRSSTWHGRLAASRNHLLMPQVGRRAAATASRPPPDFVHRCRWASVCGRSSGKMLALVGHLATPLGQGHHILCDAADAALVLMAHPVPNIARRSLVPTQTNARSEPPCTTS